VQAVASLSACDNQASLALGGGTYRRRAAHGGLPACLMAVAIRGVVVRKEESSLALPCQTLNWRSR
jgi:hypothetical protein